MPHGQTISRGGCGSGSRDAGGRPRTLRIVAAAAALAFYGLGCASTPTPAKGTAPAAVAATRHGDLRQKWGIEITSLRTSGHGHLIDLRYRVLDPLKAATVGDPRNEPCMIDQATGTRLRIPNTPKLGPLRQSATRLKEGKIYFMLFANSGLLVKSGSKVTVAIGDFRVEDMVVE